MGKITVFKGQQIWDYLTQGDRLIRCRLKQVGGYFISSVGRFDYLGFG